jgi:hypothetical protein
MTNEQAKEIEKTARGFLAKHKVPYQYFEDLVQDALVRGLEREAKGKDWRPGFGYHLIRCLKRYCDYDDRKAYSLNDEDMSDDPDEDEVY